MARGAEETGRGLPGGRAVEAAIRAEGGEVTFIACDIGNADMVEAAVAEAAKTYGPINILFNNAGGGAVVNMSSLAAQQFFTPRRHKELPAASLF